MKKLIRKLMETLDGLTGHTSGGVGFVHLDLIVHIEDGGNDTLFVCDELERAGFVVTTFRPGMMKIAIALHEPLGWESETESETEN